MIPNQTGQGGGQETGMYKDDRRVYDVLESCGLSQPREVQSMSSGGTGRRYPCVSPQSAWERDRMALSRLSDLVQARSLIGIGLVGEPVHAGCLGW